jgi:hypothetical protein
LQLVEEIYSAADLGLKFNTAKTLDDFDKVSEFYFFLGGWGMSWETFERHGS